MIKLSTVSHIVGEGMCCGCALCSLLCPKHAIEMSCDRYGYVMPLIDDKGCIECGLCLESCPMVLSRNRAPE